METLRYGTPQEARGFKRRSSMAARIGASKGWLGPKSQIHAMRMARWCPDVCDCSASDTQAVSQNGISPRVFRRDTRTVTIAKSGALLHSPGRTRAVRARSLLQVAPTVLSSFYLPTITISLSSASSPAPQTRRRVLSASHTRISTRFWQVLPTA